MPSAGLRWTRSSPVVGRPTEDVLRAGLEPETLAALRAAGASLATDDAVAVALGEPEPEPPDRAPVA